MMLKVSMFGSIALQSALENELVEFLKELQQVVVEASQQFKPLPEFGKLSKNLSELYMKNSDVRLRN